MFGPFSTVSFILFPYSYYIPIKCPASPDGVGGPWG